MNHSGIVGFDRLLTSGLLLLTMASLVPACGTEADTGEPEESAGPVTTRSAALYAGPSSGFKPIDIKWCNGKTHSWNYVSNLGIERSWALESNISFKEVSCTEGHDITINWNDDCFNNKTGNDVVNMYICASEGLITPSDAIPLLIHELGHALNFGHENSLARPEVMALGEQCAAGSDVANPVGPFDPASIMLGGTVNFQACGYASLSNLSQTDVAGVQEFYGAPRPVAAASWGPNRMDAFFRAKSDNNAVHAYWSGGSWGLWNMGGGRFWGGPGAAAPSSNHLFVLGRNAFDFGLYAREWNGSAWSSWYGLGGWTKGVPVTVKRSSGVVDVFIRGTANDVFRKSYTNGWWSADWENIGISSGALGTISAMSWAQNRVDLVWRQADMSLGHRFWNGSTWSNTTTLPGSSSGDRESPAATSWGINRIDVFTNAFGDLRHYYYNGSGWGWWTLGPGAGVSGSPVAKAWAPNRIAVFYRTTTGALMYRVWNGAAWTAPSTFAVGTTGDPSVEQEEGTTALHVFYKKGDHFFTRRLTNGTTLSSETEFLIDGI